MVEPVPEQFAALEALRGGDPRFRLVRAAVTDHDGSVEMTCVAGASMLSSVNEAVVRKNGATDDMMHRITVPAVTFSTLMGEQRFDVLHVDTEGHDAVVLDQVVLPGPAIVMYESEHLAADDRERCEARLRGAGYRVTPGRFDTVAVRL